MKSLLFLLSLLSIPIFSFSQTRVTAYRQFGWPDDGPCSIVTFLKEHDTVGSVKSAKSGSPILASGLANEKRRKRKWEKGGFFCETGAIGVEVIPVMLVIETRKKTDTLFLSGDLKSVIDIKRKSYAADEKCEIKKLLYADEKMRFLFEPDLGSIYDRVIASAVDSVDIAYIKSPILDRYLKDHFYLERDFGWKFTVTEDRISKAELKQKESLGKKQDVVFGISLGDGEGKLRTLFR